MQAGVASRTDSGRLASSQHEQVAQDDLAAFAPVVIDALGQEGGRRDAGAPTITSPTHCDGPAVKHAAGRSAAAAWRLLVPVVSSSSALP